MTISISWGTKVINVPKSDLVLVQAGPPQEIRELDLNVFRLSLKNLEDSEEGIWALDTHSHNPPVTVGGVTLARVIEIINGYTVTFEDGQYSVNLIGANSNVADRTNVNQVSVRSANSAGLVTVVSGSGVTEQDKLDIADRVWDGSLSGHVGSGSFGELLLFLGRLTGNKVTKVGSIITIFEENGTTPWRQYDLSSGGRVLL